MIYTYNKKTLLFKKVGALYIATGITVIVLSISAAVGYGFEKGVKHKYGFSDDEIELMVLSYQSENKFHPDSLKSLLQSLNVKFPDVVYAQAVLETGNFKSDVFKENHNLFGMKEAKVRATTAKGTSLNHAFYDSWQESVYDYALYACRYLPNVKTKEEYLQYLGNRYAEDPDYVSKLKKIIEK